MAMDDRVAETRPPPLAPAAIAARRMELVAWPSGLAPETPPSGEGMPSGSVGKAARESQRRDFLRVFNEQMEDLQRDPEAWADYWAEAELTSVSDGID